MARDTLERRFTQMNSDTGVEGHIDAMRVGSMYNLITPISLPLTLKSVLS